jgi:hypothetical protein
MQYQPLLYQIRFIAEVFGLDQERAYSLGRHLLASRFTPPSDAKAFFAVPAWSSLANNYGDAVTKMLEIFAKHMPFDNKLVESLTNESIQQSDRSREAWEELQKEQGGDILVLAAQLGSLHQNQCLRKARESFRKEEFELGVLATSAILIMHPHWKVREMRSYIDTGDEYLLEGDGEEQTRLLTFSRSINGFTFSHRPDDLASPFAGVATGFLH